MEKVAKELRDRQLDPDLIEAIRYAVWEDFAEDH